MRYARIIEEIKILTTKLIFDHIDRLIILLCNTVIESRGLPLKQVTVLVGTYTAIMYDCFTLILKPTEQWSKQITI